LSTKRPALKYDVFVAPELPFNAAPPRVANSEPPAWDPKTATLIFGERDAVLVDALATVREATALADWIALHDRRLTTIYITHGHGDHFLGLPVLLDRYPDARAVATSGTVELMRRSINPDMLDKGFRAWFPGQLSDRIVLADPLDSAELDLEGRPLVVIETGHTDAPASTSLHVPDLNLIIAGDVVYTGCHMFVGATTADSRAEWIAALDRLAALHPVAVVAGHKDPTQGNPPSAIGESRDYIEFYGKQRDAGLSDQALFDAMIERFPDRVSRQEFLILPWPGARA
jgi:glyoxylase-like metal-dependent hydrolase (beta-lactamase superfamily II)